MAIRLNSCNNISDFSDYTKGVDISHDKMHLKSRIDISSAYSIIINTTSLINKYYDNILKTCKTIKLSDVDYLKYKYQPKLYCYDTYQTTEIWSLLLKVNNLTSVSEFSLQTLKVFNDEVFEVLNEIMILEQTNIINNIVSLEEN